MISLFSDMGKGVSDEEASLSWLQKQQKKLRERRDNQRRRESRDRDGEMLKELKSSLNAARSGASTPTIPAPPPQSLAVTAQQTQQQQRQVSPMRTFDVVATISPKQQSFMTSTPNGETSSSDQQQPPSINIPVILTSTSSQQLKQL